MDFGLATKGISILLKEKKMFRFSKSIFIALCGD